MEVASKLAQLLPHWIEHNESHAQQFEEWGRKAEAAGLEHVAKHLEAAARTARQANLELSRSQGLLGGE